MIANPRHRLLDRVFDVSIIVKGISGVIEFISGIALFFVDPIKVHSWFSAFTAHMVGADRHSPIWTWFEHLGDALNTRATVFAAVYLLLHGVVKIVLVWALLKQQMWAYPWMLAALTAFIAYQCYDLIVHFSWWMLALTVFDVVIVVLTVREWQLHKQRSPRQPRVT